MANVMTKMGVCALLWCGCGDAQLSAEYRGTPLWSIDGRVDSGGVTPAATWRMALFFSPAGIGSYDYQNWIELRASGLRLQPSLNYQLNVFETPSAEMMARDARGQSLGYAVGRVLVYDDRNGDGARGLDEPYIGMQPTHAFYYLPDTLTAMQTQTVGPVAVGFSRALLPLPCGMQPPAATDAATCGVPLGAQCGNDSECKGGTCLRETNHPWPAGTCVLPDPPPTGCRPMQAAYMGRLRFSPTTSAIGRGFYLRACSSDADCFRPQDRDTAPYTCDPATRGCVPRPSTLVVAGGPSTNSATRFDLEPFCFGGAGQPPPMM